MDTTVISPKIECDEPQVSSSYETLKEENIRLKALLESKFKDFNNQKKDLEKVSEGAKAELRLTAHELKRSSVEITELKETLDDLRDKHRATSKENFELTRKYKGTFKYNDILLEINEALNDYVTELEKTQPNQEQTDKVIKCLIVENEQLKEECNGRSEREQALNAELTRMTEEAKERENKIQILLEERRKYAQVVENMKVLMKLFPDVTPSLDDEYHTVKECIYPENKPNDEIVVKTEQIEEEEVSPKRKASNDEEIHPRDPRKRSKSSVLYADV